MKFFPFHVKFHSYSSRDFNSRDSRDYGPPPRDYSYRDYPNSGSRDDYGSMSRGYRYANRVTWRLNFFFFSSPQLKYCLCHLVIVMATVEDENPEAIWTVRVVDHIETPMMVTVRHDYIGVPQRQAVKKHGDQSTGSYHLHSHDATALCPIQRKCFRRPS